MLIWVRVALISRVDRAVAGLAAMLRVVGHEPVGVLTTALGGSRYGADSLSGITGQAGDGFDVVVAGSPSRIAPLLAALDADVAISAAFPMLIPAEALDVPRSGIINTHPSLLPRYRGPNPIAWTVRNGGGELGYTVHRMDRGREWRNGSLGVVFDHVGITVSDLGAFERLYRTVLSVLGVEPSHADAELVEWEGWAMSPPDRGHPVTRGLHVGFRARDREAVGAFWRAGIDAGYSDAGAPEPARGG